MISTVQSVDVGNFACKAYDGSQLRLIPSLIARAPTGTTIPTTRSERTRYFQYIQGPRESLMNQIWVVGAGAASFRTCQYLANNDSKLSHALQLVLCNLFLPQNGGSFNLHKLVLFLPEVAKEGEQLINDVAGTHMFTLNGVTHTVIIDRSAIEVLQEGAGVAHFCRERNLVPKNQYIGLIDVGGGTFIGTLFNEEGELVTASRKIASPENRSGVYSGLAVNISQHPVFIKGYGSSPDPKLIVKAISEAEYELREVGSKPTYILVPKQPLLYGQTGFDFTDIFVETNDEWWKNALKDIYSAWTPWHASIGKIAVCGGGAPLLGALIHNPRLKEFNKYFIPEDPDFPQTSQIANAVGGWGLGSVDGLSERTLSDDLIEVVQMGGSSVENLIRGKRK